MARKQTDNSGTSNVRNKKSYAGKQKKKDKFAELKMEIEKFAVTCANKEQPNSKGIYSQEWAEKLGAPKKKQYLNYKQLMQRKKQEKLNFVKSDTIKTELPSYNQALKKQNLKDSNKYKPKPNGGWWIDTSNPLVNIKSKRISNNITLTRSDLASFGRK